MQANLKSFTSTFFWFGVGVVAAILVSKSSWVNLESLAFSSESVHSSYQHRLIIPTRVLGNIPLDF